VQGLFFDYRDPIFGIMFLIFLIFFVSFLTYSFSIYKERKSRKEYRKLLERFELGSLKKDDYVHLYTTYNLPFDSIILLASTFLHKGNYNKAISVYLALLEHVKDNVKKEELLELLGTTYFKAGLLQRSKDIFLKILKFSPRNKTALHHLLIIYERLKDFKMAEEVLESLNEIDVDIFRDKFYISTLKIINDPTMSYEKKTKSLMAIFKINKITERLVAKFLIQFNKPLFWENISRFNHIKIIDLLWFLDFNDIDFDKVQDHKRLKEIYTAKGYIKSAIESDIFELYVLITLHHEKSKIKADLNFQYLCTKCKKIHPIYESRCPHCHSILTLKAEPLLARSYHEEYQTLQ